MALLKVVQSYNTVSSKHMEMHMVNVIIKEKLEQPNIYAASWFINQLCNFNVNQVPDVKNKLPSLPRGQIEMNQLSHIPWRVKM